MIRFACLMIIFSSMAMAQVEREVIELNDQIRQTVLTQTIDQRTLLRVKNQLQNVLATLDGSTTPDLPRGSTLPSNVRCLARDNDHAAPYIFGAELPDFTIKRYPEIRFGSLSACQDAISSARPMLGALHTCVSRDNDGVGPFTIGSFTTEKATLRTESFRTLDQCQDMLQKARISQEAWMVCVARDNDGVAPWVRLVIKRDGTSSRQGETFSSIDACLNN